MRGTEARDKHNREKGDRRHLGCEMAAKSRKRRIFRCREKHALPTAYVFTMCYLGAVLGLFWDDIKSGDTLLVLTMSILSAIFVTLYGTRSNWKATPQGRALMYLTVAFTGVILVSASLSIIHMISPVPGEFIIKFVVYAVFILTEVHITYVLYRGQEDQRRQIRDLERKLAEAMARENAMKQMPDDNKTWETDGKESPR